MPIGMGYGDFEGTNLKKFARDRAKGNIAEAKGRVKSNIGEFGLNLEAGLRDTGIKTTKGKSIIEKIMGR